MSRYYKLTLWIGGAYSEHWFSHRDIILPSLRTSYCRMFYWTKFWHSGGQVCLGNYQIGRITKHGEAPVDVMVYHEADHL